RLVRYLRGRRRLRLRITVEPVAGFEHNPLAYAVYESNVGLLCEGAIWVGETVTVSLEAAAENKVRIYLPAGWSVGETISGSTGSLHVKFELAAELQNVPRGAAQAAPPFILLPAAGLDIFGVAEIPEAVPLGPNPFSIQTPSSGANASAGSTSEKEEA